jgi:predicted esterase
MAREWAKKFPYIKFILPTAPKQPVTLNGGMRMTSWYDIVDLGERNNEAVPTGMEQSAATIKSIIADEVRNHGVSMSRIVLGGFSQGAALSLWTGLQLSGERVAGVVALSGYLAGAKDFKISDPGKATPVFQAHGTHDALIKMSVAEKTKAKIISEGHNSQYDFRVYKNMAHSACESEMDDVAGFLANVLPDEPPKNVHEMSVKELKEALHQKGIDSKTFLEKAEMIAALQNADKTHH